MKQSGDYILSIAHHEDLDERRASYCLKDFTMR